MSRSRNTALLIGVISFAAVMLGGAVAGWPELFSGEERIEQKPPFESVKQIYEAGTAAADCEAIKGSIAALQPFLAIQEFVPAEFAQTVTMPRRKTKPTISDLAIDRIMRLENQKKKVCE